MHDGEFRLRRKTKRPRGRPNRSKLELWDTIDSVNGDRVAAPGAQGKWGKASVVERGKFLYVVIWLESLCSNDQNPLVV